MNPLLAVLLIALIFLSTLPASDPSRMQSRSASSSYTVSFLAVVGHLTFGHLLSFPALAGGVCVRSVTFSLLRFSSQLHGQCGHNSLVPGPPPPPSYQGPLCVVSKLEEVDMSLPVLII